MHKSGPVCNFGFWEDGQWIWDVKLRRRLFDWEVDQFEAFSSLLNSMMLVASNADKVVWSFESSGKFSSKSFSYEVENMNYHGNPLLSSIWKFKVPPKARLLCWQVLSGKLPTRALLSRIGVISENHHECPLCKGNVETIDHLFVHCKISLSIWWALVEGWGCMWVIPRSITDLFVWWKDMAKVIKCKEVWFMAFFSVLWHIWEARNKAVFSEKEVTSSQIIDLVKFRTGGWIKAFFPACSYSLLDFFVNIFSISVCFGDVCKVKRPSQWCPPEDGSLKFNVDGSAKGKPGLAGIGGLLRNSEGVVVALFSMPVGIMDSNVAEVLAIKEASKMLNKKVEFNSVKIVIESDSLNAVSWTHTPIKRPWRFLPYFQEVDIFLSSCSSHSIVHVHRECNSDADKLAKDGVHRTSPLTIWKD
ncbi:hypothetical protein CTI12_AA559960 [Artemisia annua]|uniref:RNase H type-1 domain-containing protein n=1 Tax=Artemisia annua TaxID=35608 RepID=A0A2U1KWE7_ARTAN|nr:hypothetical protein CTI12_AA559960 [Artemisia annua]